VNVVLMHLRKKSLPVISLERLRRVATKTRKEGFRATIGLAGSIDRMQLQRAVNDLPPGYRTILSFTMVEGYEHNEIAVW